MILDRHFSLGEGVWSGWERNNFLAKPGSRKSIATPSPPKKQNKAVYAFRLRIKNDDLPEKHIFAFISISNLPRDKHVCIPS